MRNLLPTKHADQGINVGTSLEQFLFLPLGEAARQLAVERYSWSVIARRLEEIYGRVTGIARDEARAA